MRTYLRTYYFKATRTNGQEITGSSVTVYPETLVDAKRHFYYQCLCEGKSIDMKSIKLIND